MTTSPAPAIEEQVQALCKTIADDPKVQSARSIAEGFLEDEQGVALYREFMTLGRELHMKEQNGESVTNEEVAKFEDLKKQSDAHEGISAFTSAQDFLQGIATTASQYITKTLQNGRVPTEEEMNDSGCCGGGGGGG